jgi:hypothetical protein
LRRGILAADDLGALLGAEQATYEAATAKLVEQGKLSVEGERWVKWVFGAARREMLSG